MSANCHNTILSDNVAAATSHHHLDYCCRCRHVLLYYYEHINLCVSCLRLTGQSLWGPMELGGA